VGIVALGGFLYFQFSDILKLGSETINQVLTTIEGIEDIEDLDLENIEEIEDLEEIENIEGIEALENLEIEDLEQIKNIAPIIKNIYDRLPQGIIDMFQEEGTKKEEIKNEQKTPTKVELAKSEEDLLPDSIETHPNMNLVDYKGFEEIPEIIWQEVEEEYINKNTILLTYEADFPEREIAELRELEEVSEDVTEEMIEEKKENLTQLYNVYEIAN